MAAPERIEDARAPESPVAAAAPALAAAAPVSAPAGPGSMGVDQVLNLQQSIGNAAISSYLGAAAPGGAAPPAPPPAAPVAADTAIMHGLRAIAGERANGAAAPGKSEA
ncbi:hypothetical protein OJ962_25620, partial [Solirubrobacter sp. CPCC 204708]